MDMNWPLAVRRIEPQILSAPAFYGSPGEPGLYSSPAMAGNLPPIQFAGGSVAPLLALLAGSGMMLASPGLDREANRREVSGKIKPPEDLMPDDLPFGKVFAKARRAGLKEFTWRGRRFTTRLAKEVKSGVR